LSGEYGFATFGDVLDEGYDEEDDPRRRFERAYAEVVRLCRLDDAELGRLQARLEETLAFNARWGLTRFPGVYRQQRDTALVDAILLACGIGR